MTFPASHGGRRISSRNTFFLKRVLPLLFFGVLALSVIMPAIFGRGPNHSFPYPLLAMPLLMGVVFFVVLKRLIFDLADEVTDEGEALRVRFGQDEERIALADIMNVSYAGLSNPRRITLTLRQPGRFGREVSFSPQLTFADAFARPPALVRELIERVDAARQR